MFKARIIRYLSHWNSYIESVFFEHRLYKYAAYTVLLFFIFWVGSVVNLIGSKQIVVPVTIDAKDNDGNDIPSFKRYMQLARAGNVTYIRPNADSDDPWKVDGVFIKKLLVGIDEHDLQNIGQIDISLGDTSFSFNNSFEIQQWPRVNKEDIKSELHVTDDEYKEYLVLEIPEIVSLKKSHIPVYQTFFGSILNWTGDNVLMRGPFIHASFLTLMFLLCIFVIRRLFFQATNNFAEILSEEYILRKEIFVMLSVLVLSMISVIILNVLIAFLYKPDISQILVDAAKQYVPYFHKYMRPKPVERLQFIASTLFSPILIFIYYNLFIRKITLSKTILQKWFFPFILATLYIILFFIYVGLGMSGFFYIQDSIFHTMLWLSLYGIVLYPLIMWIVLKRHKIAIKIILSILAVLSICVVVTLYFMNIANVDILLGSLTLDPVLYPLSQVVAGKYLLVQVDSYYGMYPFFLAPIFKIIGLHVISFSVVMAVFMFISIMCLFASMYLLIKNKVLFLLGFLTTIFYTLLATRITPDYYFQYWPLRYIFPSLSILCVTIYTQKKSSFMYYLSFLLFSMGILWNIDVGIVVFLSWLSVLFYMEWTIHIPWKEKIWNSFVHLVKGILMFLVVLSIFALITYHGSGFLPDFSRLFEYQKIFLTGYLMVKLIPPPHLWFIIVGIYFVGLFLSIKGFVDRISDRMLSIVFYLSVLGIGLFAYYEGQSTDVTLFRISYPALILIVIYAQMIWPYIKNWKASLAGYGARIFFFAIMFFLISAPVSIISNMEKYMAFVSQGSRAILQSSDSFENIDFIKKNTSSKEQVLILSYPDQGIYYAESGTHSAIDVTSIADIPFPDELQKIEQFLEDTPQKVFVMEPLSTYDMFDEHIKTILEQKYDRIASSGHGMSLYIMRQPS